MSAQRDIQGMNHKGLLVLQVSLLATALLTLSGPTLFAANYPLQVLLPRTAGTAPASGETTISPHHRIFWAYPGVPYNIRAAVVGGAYPFTYGLTNAPSGMTIDANTGEINWPNPQTDATNITLQVTDMEGTIVQTQWSIDVDASRFVFLNASAAEGGNGSFSSPYNSISDIPNNTHANRIAYFMSGTYNVLDMPRSGVGGPWERVEFNGNFKPVAWLEYPGASAIIDFGWANGAEPGVLIRLVGNNIYVDGFETIRSHIIGFQVGQGPYSVFRRLHMHTHGPGADGSNSSFIMFLTASGNAPGFGAVIQDNVFSEMTNGTGTCALKLYSMYKPLIEDNTFHSADFGTESLIAIKSEIPQFTIRRNTFYNADMPAIGGNMHDTANYTTYGEILFNNVRAISQPAIFLNQDALAGRIDVYRNTFNGRFQINHADAQDGPFYIHHNVIVSSDTLGGCVPGSRIICAPDVISSRVQATENLEGMWSEGLIDLSGNLTSAYNSYIGTHGHQMGAPGTLPPPVTPPGGGIPPGPTPPPTPPPSSGLATPLLSLPPVLPLDAEVQLSNASSYGGATFTWNVNPAPAATLGFTGAAVIGAPQPVIATSQVPSLSLAAMGLSPGPHVITVQATSGSQTSSLASANVTLVQSNLSAVRVFPNPWRSDRHMGAPSLGNVTFDNLSVGSVVKLYTVAGHSVRTLRPTDSSPDRVLWDRKNDSGDTVASGIYLYLVTDDAGSKTSGKLVLIK